ncbi:MAG: flagellar filament capping protein FliD [Sulfurimicrobium sp.]|nr:flagellar filament capping protein FliD [Sulfurimicrobium sp.]
MALSSPGIGSNLDVNSIVSQLMQLEQRPLTLLAQKEAGFQAKISAFGSLMGATSALQSVASSLVPATGVTATDKFTVFKTSVADTTIASATASSGAVAGSYSLEVTQLAQQHRLATSTTATPFSGAGGTLTTGGTLTITLDTQAGSGSPSRTTGVTIADGATPEAVRDAINAANAGVSATVVNGAAGKQLVLVGDTPGSNQFIKLSGVTALAYDPNAAPAPTDTFVQSQAAQGSAFKLNGIEVTASSNTVSDAIDGITLTLAKTGGPTTLTVTRDTSSLSAGVYALVRSFNDFSKTANDLGSYNAATKQGGPLIGDSTLRTAQTTFRNLVGSVPSALSGASLKRLSDIGVSMQKDGTLAVDSTKLNAAIGSDFTGVANLVSAYGGAFKTAADGMVGTSGLIAARTEGLNASIKGISKQNESIQQRLVQIEARYRKQFSSLDTLIAGMTQTSNYLTQQLANLPGSGN